MRVAIPNAYQLVGFFARREPRRLPLSDRAADPGIFGRDSVTWRVLREPLLILGGGRALLLQAAHPLVAQGAIEHSRYATDPYGRLDRTLTWVTQVSFGTRAEARAACEVVNRLHARVRGELPRDRGTPKVRAGTAYSALDADLLVWVLATFVDTLLVSHDALVGGLSEADRDAFVMEWHRVGRLMDVPLKGLWRTHAQLRAYIEEQVGDGPVHPGPGSILVSDTILRPQLPSPALRPAYDAAIFVTVGLLPSRVRREYGILWTPAHDAAHLALRTWLRTAQALLPSGVRRTPVYDFAVARAAGKLASRQPGRRSKKQAA